MKNGLLKEKTNSTLSCILKCLRFFSNMIHKKIIFGLFIFGLLGACTAPTAMLGPAYTLTSSGSIVQAGFSYGSSELVTAYTGKTPMENLIEITSTENINIHKQTLESEDFKKLVEKRIQNTNNILKSINQ
ncbi:hypothetical protein N9U47_00930 [Candidatus Pelagibacter sp.]|nr:hypothetical protein [Candidatus Pelagibacter sp.]